VVSASFNRACSTKQSRRTKRDISAIRAAILDVIEDDPPMTVRQVFYQLVARGVIDASLVARLRSVIAPADGRRVWRMVVLATQTPATRVLPGPHPKRTCVIMPSD
jgi:citrate lyase gamma subunit